MAEPTVDALAVMDDAHKVLGEIAFKYRRKIGPFATQAVRPVHMLPKARAAVAELIEADREYDRARTALDTAKHARGGWAINPLPHSHPTVIAFTAASLRRHAALARVGGAK